jgi:uncharacterized protein YceK
MKIKPRILYFVLIILLNGCLGCSTCIVHTDASIVPGPYIGTKRAVKETARHWDHYDYYGQVLLYATDVPLCLIADTVVLPYDIYRARRR